MPDRHIPGSDTCVFCGRDMPEGYGHVCTECIDRAERIECIDRTKCTECIEGIDRTECIEKAALRVNANIRMPKPNETLTITLRYSGRQLIAGAQTAKPFSRIRRLFSR